MLEVGGSARHWWVLLLSERQRQACTAEESCSISFSSMHAGKESRCGGRVDLECGSSIPQQKMEAGTLRSSCSMPDRAMHAGKAQ